MCPSLLVVFQKRIREAGMDGRLQNLRQMLEAKKANGSGGVKCGRRNERLASAARRDKGKIGRKEGGGSLRIGLNWVLMKRKREEEEQVV